MATVSAPDDGEDPTNIPVSDLPPSTKISPIFIESPDISIDDHRLIAPVSKGFVSHYFTPDVAQPDYSIVGNTIHNLRILSLRPDYEPFDDMLFERDVQLELYSQLVQRSRQLYTEIYTILIRGGRIYNPEGQSYLISPNSRIIIPEGYISASQSILQREFLYSATSPEFQDSFFPFVGRAIYKAAERATPRYKTVIQTCLNAIYTEDAEVIATVQKRDMDKFITFMRFFGHQLNNENQLVKLTDAVTLNPLNRIFARGMRIAMSYET